MSEYFNYTGMDISEGLIERARKQYEHTNFTQGSVLDILFESGEFDAFFTAATLLHIPKDKIKKALQEISRVTKSNSVGFISLKKGEGEEEREDEDGRHFSYFNEDEFKKILHLEGFSVLKFFDREDPREGKPNWLMFIVQKDQRIV